MICEYIATLVSNKTMTLVLINNLVSATVLGGLRHGGEVGRAEILSFLHRWLLACALRAHVRAGRYDCLLRYQCLPTISRRIPPLCRFFIRWV